MRIAVVMLMTLALLTSPALAEVTVNILKGQAVNQKKVELLVSVVDDAGRPVRDLPKEAFHLMVGGQEIEPFTVKPVSSQEPLSVILAIDISGSMKGKPFDKTKEAVQSFLFNLEKTDFAALLTFGTKTTFITDFVQDKYQVWRAVAPLRAVDLETHLYEATYEALEKGKESPTSRVAVILLTDGRDEGSTRRTRLEAVNKATGSSIPVFTIGFGHKIDRGFLAEIARVSGGHFFFAPSPEELTLVYQKALDQLKNQYLITFDFQKEPSDYKAVLTLRWRDKTVKATKQFLYSPKEELAEVARQVKEETKKLESLLKEQTLSVEEKIKALRSELEKATGDHAQKLREEIKTLEQIMGKVGQDLQIPWYQRLSWKEWLVLGASAALALALIIWLMVFLAKRKKVEQEIIGLFHRIPDAPEDCQLEFPEEYPTPMNYVSSRSLSRTKLASEVGKVFLQVDCLKGNPIPLIYQGVQVLDELIISRKAPDRTQFKKVGKVYLWTKNRFVSGPNQEGRPGHARIFLKGVEERYAIEDLGSVNGTFINNTDIRGKGEVLLHDGDVIWVGGKEGMRIVYKEREQEPESYDLTQMSK